MKFIFYSPAFGPPWDYSSLESGIGGSETFHIEMATRLAARGHEVVSYNNLRGMTSGWECGVSWRKLKDLQIDPPEPPNQPPCIFVIQRDPAFLDGVPKQDAGHRFWHVFHDVSYPNATPECMSRSDRINSLSPFHGEYLTNMGFEKVTVSGGGIAVNRIEELECKLYCSLREYVRARNRIDRNPKRLIYASSQERGLLPLLKSFARAKEHWSE